MTEFEDNEKELISNIKSFYEDVYYAEAAFTKVSSHTKHLVKRLAIGDGDKVLDVACGTGEWLIACQAAKARPSGVDLSERAIAKCRQRMPTGEFYAQAAETLPFPDATFDVVTCLGSLEHFVRPEAAIREMIRVAKQDALIILLVPNAGFLTRRLGFYKGTWQTDAREIVLTLEAWQNMFTGCGLTVIKRWKDLHVLSWHWISHNGLPAVPARLIQALLLLVWPLQWQYQVYHLCRKT